ncbi:hypothetical protein INT43_005667 [Umbelopsis isabellina]|uniref:Alpha/beta hydrolase fold-3 domain-containing protein n=1 Tax=Mortierella isabellina TaxID=91625 RepID=A0A8H7PLU6_MORIS|nr:hypothetical protein INT43_005667 [Umbelopsis isabellina]
MADSGPPKPELTLVELFKHEPPVIREKMERFWNKTKVFIPMTEIGSVTETSFKSIDQNDVNIRVYTPEGQGPFPAIVYYHGGGFVLCNLDTHDFVCRALCKFVEAVVISVEYRLAPEAKYPKGVEDCYAALCHVHDNAQKYNIDNSKIAVCGDSAGGNLSTVTCILAKERNGPKISFQGLLYPVTDFAFKKKKDAEDDGKPKHVSNALDRNAMNYFGRHYLTKRSEAFEPYASPIRADVSNLPPALIIVAELDVLRAEGIAYYEKLKEAGVDCKLIDVSGQDHGFLTVWPTPDPQVRETFEALFKAMKEALSVSPKANL